MNLRDQVFAHAALMAAPLEENQVDVLRTLCTAASASLAARMRKGIQPEDCKADFIAAASMFALAALTQVREGENLEQITAGDLTLRKKGSGDVASNCLRHQAELVIAPYLKDRFCFLGV